MSQERCQTRDRGNECKSEPLTVQGINDQASNSFEVVASQDENRLLPQVVELIDPRHNNRYIPATQRSDLAELPPLQPAPKEDGATGRRQRRRMVRSHSYRCRSSGASARRRMAGSGPLPRPAWHLLLIQRVDLLDGWQSAVSHSLRNKQTHFGPQSPGRKSTPRPSRAPRGRRISC